MSPRSGDASERKELEMNVIQEWLNAAIQIAEDELKARGEL